jgi:hypothetical protein
MTLTQKSAKKMIAHKSPARTIPPEAQQLLTSFVSAQPAKTPRERKALEAAVIDAVQSRRTRELANLESLRAIRDLHDKGVSQRQIAKWVGVSQAEVSRRLKRRSALPGGVSPREIALRRAAGRISTEEMMHELSKLTYTSVVPDASAAFDGGASGTGTAKQLASSFQEGLLSRDEYENLRRSVHTVRKARTA